MIALRARCVSKSLGWKKLFSMSASSVSCTKFRPNFELGEHPYLESKVSEHMIMYGDWLRHDKDQRMIPEVLMLKEFIDKNHEIKSLFKTAFAEVPYCDPFDKDHSNNVQVRDIDTFLCLLNQIVTSPPMYENRYFVGLPISTIINWVMNTPSGCKLFQNKRLNEHFKLVLNSWSRFLKSRESCLFLTTDNDNGWLGHVAMRDTVNQDGLKAAVEEVYQCDPSLPHYGFTSWDAYFTRQFRPGQRPVTHADDDSLIVSGCESAPYRVAHNVQREDKFWLKSQPYSLRHMLGEDEKEDTVDYFAGGTVYQAYLSAMSYHRWHSPVNGRVVRCKTIDGAYFAACPSLGFDVTGCDSQAYYSEVATRSLVFIECDNPAIGLMCFMAVGMGEVSTCEITCKVGDTVKKGDELGMFHFGGSTHCMLFGKHVKLMFDLGEGNKPSLGSKMILLNKNIAQVLMT